jgi:PAS domain S-box-containing protein
MNWVTVIWSMVASACLTLTVVHGLAWFQRRSQWAYLLFAIAAAGTAGVSAVELWMMHAATPGQFATATRWLHVPMWAVFLALVGIVRVYLQAGRPWLAWTVCVVRTISLPLNFLVGQNLNFLEVSRLRSIPFLGESVAVAEGMPNPWMAVGQAGLYLFVIFAADATAMVWRRGDRRRALTVGGSIIFFMLVGALQSVLFVSGVVNVPFAVSLSFLGVVGAMAWELSREAIRATQLADDLRESEERSSLATEAAGVGVWMWSIARNQVWGSARWFFLFGFGPDAAPSFEDVVQRIHPDDRATMEREVRRALDGRGAYAGEYRVMLPDNTQRWIAARGRLQPASHGRPARMLGTAVDVTERKWAEERLRLVVEAAPSGMILADPSGRIVMANAEAETIFSRTRTELIGQTFSLLLSERDRHAGLVDLTANVPRAEWGLFGRRKDGSKVPVEVRVNPMHMPEGLCLLASIVDITARKLVEQEIAQQRNELAHLSRVATLGELSGALAHELNQPLTAILSNAQAAQRFLADEPPDLNEVRDILRDIVQDDERAGEVIRRLRGLLKKEELDHVPLDLNVVVQDALRLTRTDLQSRNVTLRTTFAPELPAIRGDCVQLQQVLLNLIMNATDAMAGIPREDRRLLVCTEAMGPERVRVSLSDSGTGIAPAIVNRMFDAFATTKPLGLGLGLKVCQTILTTHGGHIEGKNNPGQGTTFNFTLPAAEGARRQPDKQAREEVAGHGH